MGGKYFKTIKKVGTRRVNFLDLVIFYKCILHW